ncbi:MAG TPA: type II toxin-antitoxin system VapC family toxin [Solirubrobacteraceae bacterium]|nr:type II toxin-antitoxin system VapC family toxin [Solirubrobacteraceae bacterium]
MRLVLDTHVALWVLAGDERLSARAAELLGDPAQEVLLSAVVLWEVSIKRSLGKLAAPAGFADRLLEAGAVGLPVTLGHARQVEALPWHHRDPFDRMLVAQARMEGAGIVSSDTALRAYGVPVEW